MNATRGCWYKALLTLVIMAIVVVSMCLLAAVVSGGELSPYRVTGSAWRLSLHGWGEVWDWGVPVHVRRDRVGPVRVVYPTADDDPLQDLEDGHAFIEMPPVLTEWRGNGVLLAQGQAHGTSQTWIRHNEDTVSCEAQLWQDSYGWFSSQAIGSVAVQSYSRAVSEVSIDPTAEQLTQAEVEVTLCSYHFGALRDVQSTNYDRAEWGHGQYVAGYYDNAMDRWLVVWKYYPTEEAARTHTYAVGSDYYWGEDLYLSFKAYERMGTAEKFPMKVICNGDTPYRGLSGWWLDGEESYRWYWGQSRVEVTDLRRVWTK